MQRLHSTELINGHGDLNNTHAGRPKVDFTPDAAHNGLSLAIPEQDDDAGVRDRYRPFLLAEPFSGQDWVAGLELSTALRMVKKEIIDGNQDRLRILVLFGSLRSR